MGTICVVTTDIPGALLHSDIDELVHVKFKGTIVQLLVKVNPSLYRKFMHFESGQPDSYAKLAKVLYGTMRAALIFWKD
jgi:hypothetical protein